ncbi:MAG: hypothetical protein RLZZ230_729 [Candidatus Parcubacteria bacterium]|jgi:broad specificity phosphatase PhoE
MKKKIYFLRHGECESNATGEPYLGKEARLTNQGIEEVKGCIPTVRKLNIDTFVSSSSIRAQQTAEIISEEKSEAIVITDLFTEREHPSELIGVKHEDVYFTDVKRQVKELFIQKKSFSDEENFDDLVARSESFKIFLESMTGETILVVGHGRFTKFFLAYLCFGKDLTPEIIIRIDEFAKSSNLGLSEVAYDTDSKNWLLKQWNAMLISA